MPYSAQGRRSVPAVLLISANVVTWRNMRQLLMVINVLGEDVYVMATCMIAWSFCRMVCNCCMPGTIIVASIECRNTQTLCIHGAIVAGTWGIAPVYENSDPVKPACV